MKNQKTRVFVIVCFLFLSCFETSLFQFTTSLCAKRSWLPCPWSGDMKILPAPRTNQIAGYRPLTIKDINKYNYYNLI